MAGLSPERFQRALTAFKRSVSTNSPDLLDQFSFSSLLDLQTACHDMQNEMGQNGRLRRMRRMQGFIEAMDHLGKSVEIFVNANDLVCFIWGPIKFCLGMAKTHVESFDKLLDVYEKVGSTIPGLLAYRSMLEKHPPLATVLEDYYSDILRFHEAALKVFARPTWKKLFKSAWKTFDTEFQPLLQSLANRRELLESEKGSASLYEISKAREEMAARHEAKKQELRHDEIEKHKWRLLKIKAGLEAPDYQQDQEMALEARNVTDSGDWVLQFPAFKDWVNKTTTQHGVLYIHGIPGSGKTTLISSIVAKLLDENSDNYDNHNTLIAYFYIKHKQPKKDTHNSLLRAMMDQIVSRDRILSDHLFDKLTSVEGVELRSTKCLEPLIATALETFQRSFIVVDGLDEACSGETAKSLRWLLSLVQGRIKEPTTSVRVLCSGRRDGTLDNILFGQPSIAIETIPEHSRDILKYCEHMGAKIRRSLDISSTMEDEIITKVASQANGMFLYARVVLDNLLGQVTLRGLRQELQPDTFPKGIDQAYERVAVRMLTEAPNAARQAALKILGWVTCAGRPLHWREIQSIFCVDLESKSMDYEDRRLRVSCKQLCGSLVDVHRVMHSKPGPDDIVTIVHESAREYLVQKRWIDSALEHAKAATFCFRYLTSEPFCMPAESISLHVKQGYYGFQDYAVQHCLDHFERRTRLESHEDILRKAMESARQFLATYSLLAPQDLATLSHHDIACVFNQLPKDKRERASTLNIGYRTLDIRTVIEKIRVQNLPSEDEAVISNVYGNTFKYKCPKIWCDHFTTGFSKDEDRQKHVDSHDRPFRCPEEGCFAFQLGYSTKDQMEEHAKKYHSPVVDEMRFPKATRPRYNDTLGEAAGRNDLAAMLAFLESGAAIHGTKGTKWNRIPICRAARKGHVEACKLLLEWGVSLVDTEADLPMFNAIEHNHPEVVHCLISSPAPDIPQWKLNKWIHYACMCGQPDTVRILLESSHFRSRDIEEWKPGAPDWIRQACEITVDLRHSVAIVEYLLERGFSDCVQPHHLTLAKERGGEHLSRLLEPIIDLHASLASELQAKDEAEHLADEHREGSNEASQNYEALQDYQLQLMLKEQENKKRLMMANSGS